MESLESGETRGTLLRELQQVLNHEIPLTLTLGLLVQDEGDAEGLALWAPISPNLNHKSTAFAGSLNSVLTLAGWGLVWLLLKEWGLAGTIVIQESTCRYLLPVRQDFVARCARPSPPELERFQAQLRGRGKGRLELKTDIYAGEQLAVTFWGRYVVHTRPQSPK